MDSHRRGAVGVDNVDVIVVVVIVRHQDLIIGLKGNVDHRFTGVSGGHLPFLKLLQLLTASQTRPQKFLLVLLSVDLIGVLAQLFTVDAATEGQLLLLLKLKLLILTMLERRAEALWRLWRRWVWRRISRRLLDNAHEGVGHIDGHLPVNRVVVPSRAVHLNELHFLCFLALMMIVVIIVRTVRIRGHFGGCRRRLIGWRRLARGDGVAALRGQFGVVEGVGDGDGGHRVGELALCGRDDDQIRGSRITVRPGSATLRRGSRREGLVLTGATRGIVVLWMGVPRDAVQLTLVAITCRRK